jgi:hypothetical protein
MAAGVRGSGERKIAVSFYVYPEQAEELRRLSEATRVPQSVFLRLGVNFALEEARRGRFDALLGQGQRRQK